MSKSAPSKYNRIELLDSPDEIREKIRKAVTDSGTEIVYSEEKPALRNLLNIFALATDQKVEKIVEEFSGKSYQQFKEDLAEALIFFLDPFQKRFKEIPDSDVIFFLKQGAEKLFPLAQKKLDEVKKKIGFLLK